MKWSQWLENWDMTSLKITPPFLEMEWKPSDHDKDAAWALYIELLTRIATQPLADGSGDLPGALDSVYSLFPTTRAIIKEYGRGCVEFTKLAIVVLNQIVRPFTAKWHGIQLQGGFNDVDTATQFRVDLEKLRCSLVTYTGMLAEMAGVEDLTELEQDER